MRNQDVSIGNSQVWCCVGGGDPPDEEIFGCTRRFLQLMQNLLAEGRDRGLLQDLTIVNLACVPHC